MKPSTLLALILIVAGVVIAWWSKAQNREPDLAAPDAATKAIVAPISAMLAGHPNEARQLAAFYSAAAEALRRDGSGAQIIKTTADLRAFCERAVTIRFQGAFAKVPGLADAIHGPEGALAKLLGLEVTELDHAQAAAAFDAVAWACREAVR